MAGDLVLPNRPDAAAWIGVEVENVLIKLQRLDEHLARAVGDPAQHPRTGTPPNPGWFAPQNGSSPGRAPTPVAANESEERRPEEELDPLAEVRQAQWEAGMATLRRIDPSNASLTYFVNPATAPSQSALDRLNHVIGEAATRRVLDRVMPGGAPIGQAGRSRDVREHSGGIEAARDLFDYLRVGGILYRADPQLTIVKLPGDVGFVTFRGISRSSSPAIDINLPETAFFMRIHFR